MSSGSVHALASAQTSREVGEQLVDGERRRVGLGVHPLLDEVPVGVACQRDRAQSGETRVGVEREQQRALERGIFEEAVDEARPPLLEGDL